YAYVFGLEKKWMKNFEELANPHIDYSVDYKDSPFSMSDFSKMMSECYSSFGSSTVSGDVDSGSGSSGGGFSGGGSGGGGGGAW
ncbi:MAG: DUF2207 domain-containing protein, partial [Pseudobutyrivibrio sp.]|nr:DUF2207 domain-containing protein [Pseudobutyrivibrio sp.]